jgi:hypothetical protein
MTTELEGRDDALRSALRVAQKNEDRWIGLSPEISGDSEGAEQWAGTAKLRRLEVERIEALLADVLNSQVTWHDLR